MERLLVTEKELIAIMNKELHKTEKPEDYSVHNPTRYCGLKIKPKEGMTIDEIFTEKTECSYEREYCENCETSKNLKDKVQKQNID